MADEDLLFLTVSKPIAVQVSIDLQLADAIGQIGIECHRGDPGVVCLYSIAPLGVPARWKP